MRTALCPALFDVCHVPPICTRLMSWLAHCCQMVQATPMKPAARCHLGKWMHLGLIACLAVLVLSTVFTGVKAVYYLPFQEVDRCMSVVMSMTCHRACRWGTTQSNIVEQCQRGYFNVGLNRSPCTECPIGYTTLEVGSTNSSACVIQPGW